MAGKRHLPLPLQLYRWMGANSESINRSEQSGTPDFVHLAAAAFVYMSSAVISEGIENAPLDLS